MFCEKCGEQLNESASQAGRCWKCGAEIKAIAPQPIKQARPAAPARGKSSSPVDWWRGLSSRTKSISLGSGAALLVLIIIIVSVASCGGGGVTGTYVGHDGSNTVKITLKDNGRYDYSQTYNGGEYEYGKYKVAGNYVLTTADNSTHEYQWKIENNALVTEGIRFEKQ